MLNNTTLIKTSQSFEYFDYDTDGESVTLDLLKFDTSYVLGDKKYAYCVAVIVYGRRYCEEPVTSPWLFETEEEAYHFFKLELNREGLFEEEV